MFAHMPTGHYELPPLSDYTVVKLESKRISLSQFSYSYNVWPEIDTAHKTITFSVKKPPLLDVYLAPEDVVYGWKIVWA